MKEFLIWKIFALYNYWCRMRLHTAIPGIELEISKYLKNSKTTGTKYPTLWRAVKLIFRHKPKVIFEAGTGLSTIVLAAAVKKLTNRDPLHDAKIVSMESVTSWYETAEKNLPEKYRDIVDIVLGPRIKYEFMFFRGYRHSNIPRLNYDFVFLDGPSYYDENGGSFCADVFHVLETSLAPQISGVIDTRVSSVFVMQQVFGASAVRYYPIARTSDFMVERKPLRVKITSRDFNTNIWGKLDVKLETHLETKNKN
jgi:hypothetical protein